MFQISQVSKILHAFNSHLLNFHASPKPKFVKKTTNLEIHISPTSSPFPLSPRCRKLPYLQNPHALKPTNLSPNLTSSPPLPHMTNPSFSPLRSSPLPPLHRNRHRPQNQLRAHNLHLHAPPRPEPRPRPAGTPARLSERGDCVFESQCGEVLWEGGGYFDVEEEGDGNAEGDGGGRGGGGGGLRRGEGGGGGDLRSVGGEKKGGFFCLVSYLFGGH